MKKKQKNRKQHKYVSLLSVLMVFFSGLAIIGIGIFTATFIFRAYIKEDDRQTIDLFNLNGEIPSILLMHSSLCWNIPWAEANGIQYRKMYRCNDDDDRCHTKD